MLSVARALHIIVFSLVVNACASAPPVVESGPRPTIRQAQEYYDRALYSEAERVLLSLSAGAPDNYDVHFMLGNIYVRTGQYPAADRMYRHCIGIDSSLAKAWYNLALLKVKEAMSLVDEGYQRSAVDNPQYEPNFMLLKEGLITAITGE